MSKIRKIFAILQFWKVYRLQAKKSYAEALMALRHINSDAEDMAKVMLMKANLMHKLGRRSEALKLHLDFINSKFQDINNGGDREYLNAYSRYYYDVVSEQMGGDRKFNISKSDVSALCMRATHYVQHEFPPP